MLPRIAVDIATWLQELGLERYEPQFRENEIDWEVLPELTESDLEKLGLPLGHRKKLLKAIAGLSGGPAAVSTGAGPAPTPVASEAERRQLTVMFVDLVDSTALSAELDPEDLCEVIRGYQNTVTGEIARFDGHVAKYMGDGVLAYFGWPKAHEDDAERAVRAGLALTASVGKLRGSTDERLAARVGIATGQVVVGDLFGEGAAQEEGVVGDTPNLAARLQQLAAPGGIVIAPSTRRLVGRLFEFVDLGPQQLKGFAKPLNAFQVSGESRAEGRFEALHGHRLAPLIGREHELGLLLDRFERARQGEGQVVLLAGEAGIGKSRIVRALRERLADQTYMPLSHYCSSYHTNSALYPIIGLLERAAGFEGEDAPEVKLAKLEGLLALGAEQLDEAVPLAAALLGIAVGEKYPPLNLTPQREKQRTLEVLLDQVSGLSMKQPVLALYEDIHWADPTTLEVLGLLVERVQQLPVLVLMTYRPEFSPPWRSHAHVLQLSLTRLTRGHGAAIVEQVTSGKELPPEVLNKILARTDGVPLFVEELTKTVLEGGLLRDAGDRYELIGPLPPLAIPSSLKDSLMARLDRLAPVKEVAQTAAVIGREFPYKLLAAASPLPEGQLSAALERLEASELIFRRGAPPDATYTFKHALVQDAAYQTLLRSRLQQLHVRIAEVLRQHFPDTEEAEPEILAHHFTEGGLVTEAIDYWRKAGQRAMARSALPEAIAHLSKGLELVQALDDTPVEQRQELGLQLALASAFVAAQGVSAPQVGAAYARARELCDQLGDVPQWFAVRYGQCIFHLYRAELNQSRESAEDLLRAAKLHDNDDLWFFAHRAMGVAALPRGDFEAARQHLQEALALYDRERHRVPAFVYAFDPQVVCLDYLSRTLVALGDLDRALQCHEQALTEARERRHHSTLAMPLFFGSMIYQLLGEREAARERADELVALTKEQGLRFWWAGGLVIQGWVIAEQGSVEAGIGQMREGIEAWRATGAECFVPYFLALLAETHAKAGRCDEALASLSQALDRVQQTEERWLEAEHHRQKGELLLRRGERDLAAAGSCLTRALDVARSQRARFWELRAARSLASVLSEQDRSEQARELLGPVVDSFDEGYVTADLLAAKTLLTELENTCSTRRRTFV
jgi:predicted ATPase/class 3 adenylate cyclase